MYFGVAVKYHIWEGMVDINGKTWLRDLDARAAFPLSTSEG